MNMKEFGIIAFFIFCIWPWVVLVLNVMEFMLGIDYISLSDGQGVVYLLWPLFWAIIFGEFTDIWDAE